MNFFHNLVLVHLMFSSFNLIMLLIVFVAMRKRFGKNSNYRFLTNDLEGDLGLVFCSVILPVTNVLVTVLVMYLGIMEIAAILYQRNRIFKNARRN